MRKVAWVIVLFCWGCSGETEIPLEIDTDQLVLFLSTIDGEPKAQLVQRESGRTLSVQSDDDTPIYSWLVPPDAFIDPGGRILDATEVSAATFRHRRTEGGEAGSCGRCMLNSTASPQVANPGDSCPVPAFLSGAIWSVADGERSCRGGPDGKLCGSGSADDLAALEEARLSVHVEWPGECACKGPAPAENLRNFVMRAISPEQPGAVQMNAITQTPSGLVAGVSRYESFVYDPVTQHTEARPLDIDLTITHLVALRGGDLLIASETFNTGWSDNSTLHRVRIENGGFGEPELITSESPLIPTFFTYLGGPTDPTLWASGLQRSATSFDPLIVACDDQTLGCTDVPIIGCSRPAYYGPLQDLELLDDGTGIGFSYQALYVKPARPPPMMNPHPADAWNCFETPENVPWPAPSTEPPAHLERILGIATYGQRVYACAETRYENCEPNYAVIMTATVTPGAPLAALDFKIAYQGGDWSRCRRFVDVPGLAGARAIMPGQVTLDFDADGNMVKESRIADLYGPVDGYQAIEQPQPGAVLAWATENRVMVSTGSTAGFAQAYGPPRATGAAYDALIALDDGDFLAFGDPRGFTRVRVTDAADFPVTTLELIPDPTGARRENELRGAVLDHAASTATHLEILTGGRRDNAPYLTRYTIDEGGLGAAGDLRLPDGLGNVLVLGLAEIGPSSFLAILEGSHVLWIRGNEVTEVEIDYDDPTTALVESKPSRAADQCSREIPRLDLWQSVRGGHGVGWVGGSYEMVLRVVGNHATRFSLQGTNDVTITAIDAVCPDQVHFGGRGNETTAGGDVATRLQLFRTTDELTTAEGAAPDQRQLQVGRIGRDDLDSVILIPISSSLPRAFLRDSTQGQGSRGERPFTVILDNGFLHRMFVSERISYSRAPFSPWVVSASPKGWVLFGGGESRLALGVPR